MTRKNESDGTQANGSESGSNFTSVWKKNLSEAFSTLCSKLLWTTLPPLRFSFLFLNWFLFPLNLIHVALIYTWREYPISDPNSTSSHHFTIHIEMCDVRKTDCHRFSFVRRVKFNAGTRASNIWSATTMARCKCDKNYLYTWHARFALCSYMELEKPMKALCSVDESKLHSHITNHCGTEWAKSFKLWRWNPTQKLYSSVVFADSRTT